MDVQELLDKQQIHEALMRYARGVDRGDAALICSAYHPDAVDEHGVGDYTGVTVGPGIVEMMADLRVSSHHDSASSARPLPSRRQRTCRLGRVELRLSTRRC